MGIEQLSRVQWALIGGIVGIALGLAISLGADNTERMQSSDPLDFERDVIFADAQSHKPLITDVVIHPTEYSRVVGGQANLVTYKRLATDRNGRYGWKDKYFVAKIPYVPAMPNRNIRFDDKTTVQSYLAELASQYNTVKFSYGWWLVPTNAIIAGLLGGVVVLGGVWPVLLNIMLGAGLGRRSEEEGVGVAAAFSLWRYKPRRSLSTKARPTVTAADQQEAQAIADAYERRMLATAAASGNSAPAPKAEAPAVKQLNTQAVEAVKPADDDDEIELRNKEYYPVVIHHHKHHDPKNPDAPAAKK